MGNAINGTVIQRSFVGREANNIIHIASAPVSELGYSTESLNEMVAGILGISASSILDGETYRELRSKSQFLQHPDAELKIFSKDIKRRIGLSLGPDNNSALFSDFIAYCSTPVTPMHPTQAAYLSELMAQEGNLMRRDVLQTAYQCWWARISRTREMTEFINEIYEYEIPFAQSPDTTSNTLKKLLDDPKAFCLAPLAMGSFYGLGQLAQGNYVSALQTTATGSGMTLILVVAVPTSLLLINTIMGRRGKPPSEPPDKGSTETPDKTKSNETSDKTKSNETSDKTKI